MSDQPISTGQEGGTSAEEELDLRAGFPFLPVGTVVMLKEGERPVMIAGVMEQDGSTGRLWDYMGYPYPEGRQDATKDHFFDRDMIASVLQFGFTDMQAVGFQVYLSGALGEYERLRKAQDA